jgi:tetratricopeptide (TPR) repeat protein
MRSFFAFFILFLTFPGLTSPQEKPSDPRALQLFIEGKTLELQDNYLAAIGKYNEALKIERAAGIYYTLSKLYNNVSQYQNSLEAALEALKIAPGNLDYMENAADVYLMLNDYDSALKYLKEVSEKRPDDINILYNIGRLYEVRKQPSQAIKYYEKITEDYQYDESVLRRMVLIYEGYKDYANSAASMEKLLSLYPTDTELKFSIAATYLKIPDYDNALRVYDDILSIDPKNRQVQTEIIKIYFRQNRNDLAFAKFGELVNQDTVDYPTKMGIALAFYDASLDDSSALEVAKSILENIKSAYQGQWMPDYYLALIEARTGGTAGAEEKFKQILEIADTSAEAHVQVGFYYYEQNRLDEALNIFEKGAVRFSDEFRLNFLTGNTYYRLGKQKECLPYLEKALSISPSDLNTLSTLGIVYDNLNMDRECEELYAQGLSLYPDNILLLNNYAYHLAERGKKLKEALEMSRKTIEQEPENSSYLDTYGWIYYKLKDFKNAKKYIEKAVKLGSNPELLEHLGDVYEAMGEIVKALKYWNQALEENPDNKDLIYKIEKYK